MQKIQNKEFIIDLAIKAGNETLKYFKQNFNVDLKSDNSPVTTADIAANNIIIQELKKTNIEIISEESENLNYNKRKFLKQFWIVDPLDGTKQFVKGVDEYTINIALIVENKVVEGVVFAPAKSIAYYGNIFFGAEKINLSNNISENINLENKFDFPKIVASKSHLNEKTTSLINLIKQKHSKYNIENIGSSLKFCKIADGTANIYPRIGGINEWDIAAGHAVLKAAGGNVFSLPYGNELKYNSENLKTPDYIAIKDFSILKQLTNFYNKIY